MLEMGISSCRSKHFVHQGREHSSWPKVVLGLNMLFYNSWPCDTLQYSRWASPVSEASILCIKEGQHISWPKQWQSREHVSFGSEIASTCKGRWSQSLTSATPSDAIWNLASASARQGELITLQIRSSPRPLRRASLIHGKGVVKERNE
jgi:hypothetical protein